jgi:hypothetical protein
MSISVTPTPRQVVVTQEHPAWRRSIAAACFIALAAIAVRLSATTNWGSVVLADGTRVKFSPIGLTVASVPAPVGTDQAQSLSACRWWPEGAGDAALCAKSPNADAAYQRLRAAYPLLSVAVWLAVVSLFLQTLRVPKATGVRVAVSAIVVVLSAAGVIGLITGTGGSQTLDGHELHLGALGFDLAIIGVLLAAASARLQER